MTSEASRSTRKISISLQYGMAGRGMLAMTSKVAGVTGDTLIGAGGMTNGMALQGTSDRGMAGVTGWMNLSSANKRTCGRDMTV
jgi:hypothetical protein